MMQRISEGMKHSYRPVIRLGIKPYFAWFDLWVGIYIQKRAIAKPMCIYIQPVPCFGVKVIL